MAKSPKPPLDEAKARAEIRNILTAFQGLLPPKIAPVAKIVGGKLYELFVLSRLLVELRGRGWLVRFHGQSIKMSSSPGGVSSTKPHFELRSTSSASVQFEIYTDVEVGTIGASQNMPRDLSAYHEIDIVIVPAGTQGRPAYDEIVFGVECKGTAQFDKAFVREVLGRRRELSFITGEQDCLLDQSVGVRANPPSEYWLVYLDPAGDHYKLSPAYFSVELKHWQPQ